MSYEIEMLGNIYLLMHFSQIGLVGKDILSSPCNISLIFNKKENVFSFYFP